MINITSLGYLSFKIDTAVMPKQYSAYIDRQGNVILRNAYTAGIINLGDISNISVDGYPATIESLREVIFNYLCGCAGIEDNPVFKIFDYTFDYTFE